MKAVREGTLKARGDGAGSVATMLRRCSIAVASATLLLASGLSAQTEVYSTFPAVSPPSGPLIFDLGSPTAYWEASSFVDGLSGDATLSSVLFQGSNSFIAAANILTVSLLEGTSIGSANLLEWWTLPGTTAIADQVFILTSVADPVLIPGDTYWVELSSPYYAWTWDNSTDPAPNRAGSSDGGADWTLCSVCAPPTYEVYANETPAPNVSPEPAVMTLLATGLVALAGAGARRRRRA